MIQVVDGGGERDVLSFNYCKNSAALYFLFYFLAALFM